MAGISLNLQVGGWVGTGRGTAQERAGSSDGTAWVSSERIAEQEVGTARLTQRQSSSPSLKVGQAPTTETQQQAANVSAQNSLECGLAGRGQLCLGAWLGLCDLVHTLGAPADGWVGRGWQLHQGKVSWSVGQHTVHTKQQPAHHTAACVTTTWQTWQAICCLLHMSCQ